MFRRHARVLFLNGVKIGKAYYILSVEEGVWFDLNTDSLAGSRMFIEGEIESKIILPKEYLVSPCLIIA